MTIAGVARSSVTGLMNGDVRDGISLVHRILDPRSSKKDRWKSC